MLDTHKNAARLATHTHTHTHTLDLRLRNLKSPLKKLLLAASAITLFSISAQAADGCKFLLCMGAPNPMGIAECAPTVREVLRDLSKGRGLPTCQLSSGVDSKTTGNFVTYRRASLLPQCPAGYNQGEDNVFYHRGHKPTNLNRNNRVSGGLINISPSNDKKSFSVLNYQNAQRVCVSGNFNGTHVWSSGSRWSNDDNYRTERYMWYDNVLATKPDGATYEFTLHVDNKPYSKHRF